MIVIGVDVGGTSIKGASIKEDGTILHRFSLLMDKSASPEEVFGGLANEINHFIKQHHLNDEISGIGMGIPGILDKEKGVVISSPNMPTWLNFSIKDCVEGITHLPVRIINDASAAALGEARFGSGKDYNNLIMITLGTGVGGGIIINGELFDGQMGMGAQLGHSLLVLNGRQCSCGRKGCLEAYASATALIKETIKARDEHPESIIKDIEKELGTIDARVAFIGEKRGDPVCHKLVEEYIMYLSEGLLDYCNIFRPDVFVLSGGVANEGEYLISRIEKYMEARNYGYIGSPKIPVKQASLGYDSGKIGAASLFFERK